MKKTEPVVGLALGSGSARGWTHIGVIQALENLGVRPQVVAGTSIGALVGAVYVSGQLSEFADWVRRLSLRDVIHLMDLRFSGGVVKGEKLFGFFQEDYRNPAIEELEQRFVSVATEMRTGRESWLTRGPILPAARASCAIPGLFSPVKFDDRWMLDGGLVNPVPVSAARALGADVVIAVNLNAQVTTRLSLDARRWEKGEAENDSSLWGKVQAYLSSGSDGEPGLFDAISASINIMQDRITRSRMAGDPPEITLSPRLSNFALMDFHRADEAIDEGERLVTEHAAEIRAWLGRSVPQPAG
jgi:NTE family protein